MPENIIDLDSRRKKSDPKIEPYQLMEQMSLIEDMIEQMDELGVSTREELVQLLEALESSTPDDLD